MAEALVTLSSGIGEKLKGICDSVPRNQAKEFLPFFKLVHLYSTWVAKMGQFDKTLNRALYVPTSASLNGLKSAADELSKLLGSKEEDAASKRANLIKKMDDFVNKLCKDWQDEWSKEDGEPQQSTEET